MQGVLHTEVSGAIRAFPLTDPPIRAPGKLQSLIRTASQRPEADASVLACVPGTRACPSPRLFFLLLQRRLLGAERFIDKRRGSQART